MKCDNSYIGAFLFSIGLLAVITFKCNLYTGKVCFTEYCLKPFYMNACFIYNVIGTALIACATSFSDSTHGKAVTMMLSKMSKSTFTLLFDGVLCGVFIAIAVVGHRLSEGFGKYLLVVLGVMCFILCGSEHVVADCYYAIYAHTGSLVDNLKVIIPVLLGNTCGGILSFFITGQIDG